jgi:hypothetical protein
MRMSRRLWFEFRAESDWELAVHRQIVGQWEHLYWDGVDHAERPGKFSRRRRPGTYGRRNYQLRQQSVRYDCSAVRHDQRFKRDSYSYRGRPTGIVDWKCQRRIHGNVWELHCPVRRMYQ